MKAIVTVGVSASGKSTFANKWISGDPDSRREINRDYVRFNIVNPGSDWGSYKMTNSNEKMVTEICNGLLHDYSCLGLDIIISDTNLNEKYRKQLISKLESLGYDVEIMEFPVSLEEAWKRDSLRPNGVGHSVIYKQYQKWLEYKGEKKYVPNPSLPKAIIVDIDGTVATNDGKRGFYGWDKVGLDSPRPFIIEMVASLQCVHDYKVIFVSGRDSVCRQQTTEWLDNYLYGVYSGLFMRAEGDQRRDSVVKKEIFFRDIAPNYNVVGVIDDRPQVLRECWYEIGIENVICVGNPWIEF